MNHIQVCCRIRDYFTEPQSLEVTRSVDESTKKLVSSITHGALTYHLDCIYDGNSTQENVFEEIVKPMISDSFLGFNCTLFSYGQTGSGKTYTLIGNNDSSSKTMTDENVDPTSIDSSSARRGIIPRAVELIFQKQRDLSAFSDNVNCNETSTKNKSFNTVTTSVKPSHKRRHKIYQEKLRDLLSTTSSSSQQSSNKNELRIREQLDGAVYVENLVEVVIQDENYFRQYLEQALLKRVTGSHAMNNVSSRSHLCVMLNILQYNTVSKERIASKVYFIDLAGSEMVRKTGATGERFTEAKHINKSLSALGNVIYALSAASNIVANTGTTSDVNGNNTKSIDVKASFSKIEGTSIKQSSGQTSLLTRSQNNVNTVPVKPHIPYRDSKLTRLLQNSLGGNSKTVIILTISVSRVHLQESLSTLKFGDRARQIQIKPKINKALLADETALKRALSKANQEIALLKQTVAELQIELSRGHKNNDNNHMGIVITTGEGEESTPGIVYADKSSDNILCCVCQEFVDEVNKNAANKSKITSLLAVEIDKNDSQAQEVHTPTDTNHKDSQHTTAASTTAPSPRTNLSDDPAVDKSDFCAICLLNTEQTDRLELDTGEMLGEMFSCDGNCGDQFHVRCVGLVGDGGQYSLPEGEWYCTACAVLSNAGLLEDNTDNREVIDKTSPVSPVATNNTVNGTTLITLQDSDINGGVTTVTHNEGVSASETTAQTQSNMSLLATIKTEYHVMRRERNRILSQWQQEKRVQQRIEKSRREKELQMDTDLVTAQDTISTLRKDLEESMSENKRLKDYLETFMREMQQTNKIENEAYPHSVISAKGTVNNSAVSKQDQHVPTLHHPPRDTGTDHFSFDDSPKWGDLLNKLNTASNGNTTPSHLQLPESPPHQSRPMSIAVSQASSNRNMTESTTLPDNGMNNELFGRPVVDLSALLSRSSVSDVSEVEKEVEKEIVVPKPWKQLKNSDGSRKHTVNPHVANANSSSGGNVKSVDNTSSGSGWNSIDNTVCADTTTENGSVKTDAVLTTIERFTPDNITSSSTSRPITAGRTTPILTDPHGEPSKFINPLKNRLTDLLKSVQDETGSFVEIREKYRTREDERNSVRNSIDKI